MMLPTSKEGSNTMRPAFLTRLTLAVVTCVVAFVGLTIRPAAAQTPQAPSPEELVLALLPYRLQGSDIPPGYQDGGLLANTPALQAFNQSQNAAEGQAILRSAQRAGFLSGFVQLLLPNGATPLRIFALEVDLFVNERAASAGLKANLDARAISGGPVRADNPPVPFLLGDETGALHIVTRQDDGTNDGQELLAWRSGRLLFSVLMDVPDATETIDQVLPLAKVAAARARSVTPPESIAMATRAVTSSEAVRVDAAYALYDRLPGAALSPYGMRAQPRSVITNSDIVFNGPDPAATFAKHIAATGRIIGVERDYATLQEDGNDMLAVQYVLCATPAGAQAELADPFDGNPQIASDVAYGMTQPLGDTGRLIHGTLTRKNGATSDLWAAVWVRGNVVLKVVSFSPLADVTPQQVNAFAAQVDQVYMQGGLPTILTSSDPAALLTTPPAQTPNVPVQSWTLPVALTQSRALLAQ